MTSRHTLEEITDLLAKLDYVPLLDLILEALKNKQIFKFSEDGKRLLIYAYPIAAEIATTKAGRSSNPLTQTVNVRAATVNHTSETEFYSKITGISEELRTQFDTACGNKEVKECVQNLCTALSQFDSKNIALPFSYPFTTNRVFRSQRLSIEDSSTSNRRTGTDSYIKAHHLNVRFEGIFQFDENLLTNIRTYIDSISKTDSQDRKELIELLNEQSDTNKPKSDLNQLRKVLDTEFLAKLLLDVKIYYLEYLKNECARTNISNTNSLGFSCLETLINRLKLFVNWIKDSNLDDAHYDVEYLNETVNLRTAFSQANAFDMLPIIPEYEGVIGESTDKERDIKEFNLGLRLKLNGSVNAYNEDSALDYYMTEIEPNSKRHQEQLKDSSKAKKFKEKVLKIVCLYCIIFAIDKTRKIADKDYNPIPEFQENVLNKLKPGSSNDEVKKLVSKISDSILNNKALQVKAKLEALKKLLKDFIGQKAILPRDSKTVNLCVNKKILKERPESILNSLNFLDITLDQEEQSKAKAEARKALSYIEVIPPPVNEQSLASLSVTFTFDDVRYFPDDEQQEFSMSYDVSGIKAMPVVFAPLEEKDGKPTSYHPIYKKHFETQKLIVIYYKSKEVKDIIFKNSQSPEARAYRQVFTILTYLCINICKEQVSEKLFIPIFRFHQNKVEDTTEDEVFLDSLSKALAHILRRDCLADAQGIYVKNFDKDKTFKYRVQQALSSLYALLPKTFEFKSGFQPQLDLAIVVVSSWLSDAVWNEKDKAARISNIYGEIISINRVSQTKVKVEPLKTFSDNEPHSQIYREPKIVRDEIIKLYEQGYRHILFIAKTPYSRSLGITQLESNPESLFFMDRKVIDYLKQGKSDLKLYPIFMDTYPAINLNSNRVDSFYIPDIEELQKLSLDKSQQTRVFLNLFTGKSVDTKRTFFNSVVCYSTLLNIYDTPDTRDIMAGLLDINSPLQQTILQYITLFHFSRYEVNRNITLKLNPYSKLIGDYGIGTISTYTYSDKNVKFNNLAFLTSIRSALYGR